MCSGRAHSIFLSYAALWLTSSRISPSRSIMATHYSVHCVMAESISQVVSSNHITRVRYRKGNDFPCRMRHSVEYSFDYGRPEGVDFSMEKRRRCKGKIKWNKIGVGVYVCIYEKGKIVAMMSIVASIRVHDASICAAKALKYLRNSIRWQWRCVSRTKG